MRKGFLLTDRRTELSGNVVLRLKRLICVPWSGTYHVWAAGGGAELRDGSVDQVDVLEEPDS